MVYKEITETWFAYTPTPVSKVLSHIFFGYYCIIIVLLLHLLVNITSRFVRKSTSFWSKVRSRLVQAFFLALLFCYQKLLIAAFRIVKCVEIKDEKILRIQGDVFCYNWWQQLTIVYISCFLIPVFLVLSNFPYHVKDRAISVSFFILACIFPVPFLLYFILKKMREENFIKKMFSQNVQIAEKNQFSDESESVKEEQKSSSSTHFPYTGPGSVEIAFIDEDLNNEEQNESVLSNNGTHRVSSCSVSTNIESVFSDNEENKKVNYTDSEEVIMAILLDHYKELNMFGLKFTWLCIHKLYRLILVACSTFITEPIYKLITMTSVLLLVAILNPLIKPYSDKKANLTATFSYGANLLLAMLNLLKAVFKSFGVRSNFSLLTKVLWYFDLVENILLTYIPLVFVFVWGLYVIADKWQKKKNKNKKE